MICAHAAPDGAFKRCCLETGRYDGSNRNCLFSASRLRLAQDTKRVLRQLNRLCEPPSAPEITSERDGGGWCAAWRVQRGAGRKDKFRDEGRGMTGLQH